MIGMAVVTGGILAGRFFIRLAMSNNGSDEVEFFLLDGFIILVFIFIFGVPILISSGI